MRHLREVVSNGATNPSCHRNPRPFVDESMEFDGES